MTLAITKSRLLLAATIALLLAALVAVPVVSASCVSKAPIAMEALVDVAEADPSGSQTDDVDDPAHGVCSQGHCHHNFPGNPTPASSSLRLFIAVVDHHAVGAKVPLGHIDEGPTRPPRA
ncbi:MAG: hypothetical protein KA105_00320 [Caulobacter sp.]|nr:hypothetical protein [Caulobacter sp.]